jgi:hypothetical protein
MVARLAFVPKSIAPPIACGTGETLYIDRGCHMRGQEREQERPLHVAIGSKFRN